jgi:hypothetical protein
MSGRKLRVKDFPSNQMKLTGDLKTNVRDFWTEAEHTRERVVIPMSFSTKAGHPRQMSPPVLDRLPLRQRAVRPTHRPKQEPQVHQGRPAPNDLRLQVPHQHPSLPTPRPEATPRNAQPTLDPNQHQPRLPSPPQLPLETALRNRIPKMTPKNMSGFG